MLAVGLAFAYACAAGSAETCPPLCDDGGRDGSPDAPIDASMDTTIVDSNATYERCPSGQVMTGRIATGPTCVSAAAAVAEYVQTRCFLYFGWRDDCDGCTDPPEKWGRTNQAACEVTGSNSTCSTATLSSVNVQLVGINTDGDVNDDDKLYFGFRCEPPDPPTTASSACPAGQIVYGIETNGTLRCASIGLVAESVLNAQCSLFAGWSDSCEGCSDPPVKWGRVGAGFCENGAGADNTCATVALGSASVALLGINTDGTVDDNDQIYLGLTCAGVPSAGTVTVVGDCPGDRLATGVGSDGSIECTSQGAALVDNTNTLCSTYLGWRDSCDGCTTAPARWGRTNGALSCASGAGSTNVCITPALGAYMPPLFGLNTDGDVDDNDKLYVGLRCL